jgi:hypothetical protein
LCGVTGYDGRINDIVYCHPAVRAEQDMAVVFFGGDVQVCLILVFGMFKMKSCKNCLPSACLHVCGNLRTTGQFFLP